MSSTGDQMRAAAKPGLDPDYDRFVAAWERTTEQADRLVDVIERDDDPQLVASAFRDVQARGRELQQAACAAQVERCQAPLSPGGRTTGALTPKP